jgi:hypothetical protein
MSHVLPSFWPLRLLEKQVDGFLDLRTKFSTHFLPKILRKHHRQLDKLIHNFKNPKTRSKTSNKPE